MKTTEPRKVLREGAVYWSDNGRRICAKCAGASALYTGRDLSGQKVERITVEECAMWQREIGVVMACECGGTELSQIAGADGWPIAQRVTR